MPRTFLQICPGHIHYDLVWEQGGRGEKRLRVWDTKAAPGRRTPKASPTFADRVVTAEQRVLTVRSLVPRDDVPEQVGEAGVLRYWKAQLTSAPFRAGGGPRTARVGLSL